jgi:MFS family permease
LGWRSTFWFLVIFAGVLLVLFVFLFPETCRAVVGNGSIEPKGVNRSLFSYLKKRRLHNAPMVADEDESVHKIEKRPFKIPNPLSTLRILGEKESCIVLLYNGFFFTGMMIVSAALPDLFLEAYGLDELKIGLCYISLGTGCLVSSLSTGHIVDWNFRRHAKRLGMPIVKGRQQDLRNFPIEKVRLEVVAPGHCIGTLGLIAFGWTVKYRTHIAGPEVALFVIGFGVSTAFNITNALLIDLHKDHPATATAAVNFVRCLMSAGGVSAIIPMCHAMNPGWAFTFIALVYTALISVVFWIMKSGMGWRQEAERLKELKDESTN